MSATVLIVHGEASRVGAGSSGPFPGSRDDDEAYAHLLDVAPEYGISLQLGHPSDLSENGTYRAWARRSGTWAEAAGASVDLLWNRVYSNVPNWAEILARLGRVAPRNVTSSALIPITTNKLRSYELFPDLIPPSVRYRPARDDYHECLDRLRAGPREADLDFETLVLKPVSGFGGRGIARIPDRETLPTKSVSCDVDFLIQPFLETGRGIPELGASGRHDLRVIVQDGLPAFSYLRLPPPGGFVSNLHRGARRRQVEVADLPPEALSVVRRVAEEFRTIRPAT